MSDTGIDKSMEYMQNLFTSMEIISKKQLENLAYDKTIVCTITDASQRDSGEYIVSDGTTTFRAYANGSIKYMTGAKVFVTIPQGDFSQQKIISGRYTDETKNMPYSYTPVSESFIDITLNLNQNTEEVKQAVKTVAGASGSKILYQVNANNVDGGLSQYDALYIAAEFKTLLEGLESSNNHFGLKVSVLGKGEETLENYTAAELNTLTNYDDYLEEVGESNLKRWEWKLDSAEMFGSPFNYFLYTKQEKLFDLKDIEVIRFIKVELYWDFTSSVDKIAENFENLLVKNLYVSFGTRFSDFASDSTLVPYCLQQKTYGNYIREEYIDVYDTVDEYNTKTIQLRWIWMDKTSGKFISIDSVEKMNEVFGGNAKIVWHRNDLDGDGFSSKNSEATFMMPYLVESGNPFFFQFIPNSALPLEKLQATAEVIDTQTGELTTYKSDFITFVNEDETLLNGAVDLVKALTIDCDINGQGGSYFLYGEDGTITSYAEQSKVREFRVNYTSIDGGAQMNEAESITWYIPKTRTMLVFDPEKHGKSEDGTADTIINDDPDYYIIQKTNIFFTADDSGNEKKYSKQYFSISGNYGANFSNNTVRCEVVKGGKTYTAEYTVMFGYSGSNGTDYRLNVSAGEGEIAFNLAVTAQNSINLQIDVTDNAGAAVENGTLSCDWYEPANYNNNDASKLKYSCNSGERTITITKPQNFNEMTTNYILKVIYKLPGADKEQIVTRYVPIVFYKSYATNPFTTADYAGADKICYNSFGTNPSFISSPYSIGVFGEGQLTWKVYVGGSEKAAGDKFSPSVANNILVPKKIFATGAETKVGVAALSGQDVILYQPLLIIQNAYNSAILNEWDGETVVDNANNRIMSATIAAGSKSNDNTFSGVVMGELQEVSSTNRKTSGILGFHEGAQSFGLKTDGTMFIGKSGSGRIQFDGQKSVITSDGYLDAADNGGVLGARYRADGTGIFLDLNDAVLHVGGPAISFLVDAKGSIQSGGDGSEAFSIKTNNTEKLMSVKAKTEGNNTEITEFLIQSPLVTQDKNRLEADFRNASFTAINGSGKGNLTINAADITTPFKVNDKFYINWNGSIYAEAGSLGGWQITRSGLHSKLIEGATGPQSMTGLFNSEQDIVGGDFANIRFFVGTVNAEMKFEGFNEETDIKDNPPKKVNGVWQVATVDKETGEVTYKPTDAPTYVPKTVSKAAFYVNNDGGMTAFSATLYTSTISVLNVTKQLVCTGEAIFNGNVTIGGVLRCGNIQGWHPSVTVYGSVSYDKVYSTGSVTAASTSHFHSLNTNTTSSPLPNGSGVSVPLYGLKPGSASFSASGTL